MNDSYYQEVYLCEKDDNGQFKLLNEPELPSKESFNPLLMRRTIKYKSQFIQDKINPFDKWLYQNVGHIMDGDALLFENGHMLQVEAKRYQEIERLFNNPNEDQKRMLAEMEKAYQANNTLSYLFVGVDRRDQNTRFAVYFSYTGKQVQFRSTYEDSNGVKQALNRSNKDLNYKDPVNHWKEEISRQEPPGQLKKTFTLKDKMQICYMTRNIEPKSVAAAINNHESRKKTP